MFPKQEIVENKKEYPKGTRVKLVKMDDFQAPIRWNKRNCNWCR